MPDLTDHSTFQLDGPYLVMDVYRYSDGWCRVEVVHRTSPRAPGTMVLLQRRPSMELAITAIARDLTTYATRALATLPTIGELVDPEDTP